MKQSGLMSTDEAADYLHIGRSTITKFVRDGRLPAPLRISSRKNLYRVADLDSFLDRITAENAKIERIAEANGGIPF